jgi:anti-sigma28 factor (negative regulator of flagellin synthesis)
MKVPNISSIVSIARGQLDARPGQPGGPADAVQSSDKVELSSESQAVQRLASELSTAVQRQVLVAQLKSEYESGTLQADAKGTADAMVVEGIFDDIISGE